MSLTLRLLEVAPKRHNRSPKRLKRLLASLAAIEFNRLFKALPGSTRRAWYRGYLSLP